MSKTCPDQRLPCPTPDLCQTDCHFNTAPLRAPRPSSYQSAMDHPITQLHAGEMALPAKYADVIRNMAPRESLPSAGLDLDSLLTSEGCVRIVMGVAAGVIALLACLGLLALVWHHDALLRTTWADVRSFIAYLFRI